MKKTILLIIAVCAMMLVAEKAQANDFLEKDKHYSAYAAGADKIHFKIPLYSESEAGLSVLSSRVTPMRMRRTNTPAVQPISCRPRVAV